jgi:cyclase
MYSRILFTMALVFWSYNIQAQSDTGRNSNSKVIEVSEDIYMLQGKGGNIGFNVGPDGVFMIDSQFAEATPDIIKDIERFSKKSIQFLINTHHHGDHTGGNVNLEKRGTVIVSQENVRERLLKQREETKDKSMSEKMLAMVTFKEDMAFHYNGQKIFIFHVHDAHTDGDAIVYFTESNVLHTGDVLFKGRYPYIDLDNGGTLEGYIAALENISAVANSATKIIPGHGDLAGLSDVRQTMGMLSFLYKKVVREYLLLKTEDQVAKMTNLTEKYDIQGYGEGFITNERILRTIYREVDRTMKHKRGNVDVRTGGQSDGDSKSDGGGI